MPSNSQSSSGQSSSGQPSDAQLRAFLDEALPPDQMAAIEVRLRDDQDLHRRLAELRGQQDAGMHSIGAIWRRHRLSCPDREELGQFLLGVMDAEAEQYVRFHLDRVGCRFCAANVDDLERQRSETADTVEVRRQRYFQTSAVICAPARSCVRQNAGLGTWKRRFGRCPPKSGDFGYT